MELTLEERVAALERKLLAREAAEEPTEYYTSKYSGEEIDALLGSSTRRNLLDNWYFVGGGSQQGGGQFPINQRGELRYTGSGYGIDRYTIAGASSVIEVAKEGIYFTPTNVSNGIRYYVEDISSVAGKEVTVSWLLGASNDVAVRAGFNDGTLHYGEYGYSGIISVTYTVSDSSDTFFAFIQCKEVKKTPALIAAKLEIGSTQTLAYKDDGGNWQLFETPDYAEELAKCQRYFQLYSAADKRPAKAVDCRPTMRIDPTQGQLQINAQTLYYNSAEL